MLKCEVPLLSQVHYPVESTAHKILFVCSGNTCRSPLAVAAWQAFTPPGLSALQVRPHQPPPPLTVSSAGLSARDGAPASPYAVEAAMTWGVDLSTHCARLLRFDMAREADLICTMTQEQAATVRDRFAVEPAKVRLLGSFASETSDAIDEQVMPLLQRSGLVTDSEADVEIFDPFGASAEAYQACAAQIRRAMLGLIAALHAGRLRL